MSLVSDTFSSLHLFFAHLFFALFFDHLFFDLFSREPPASANSALAGGSRLNGRNQPHGNSSNRR
jgi:hypothetical protein